MEKKLTRRESRETAFLTAFAATFEPEEPTVPAEEHAAPDAFANQLLAAMNNDGNKKVKITVLSDDEKEAKEVEDAAKSGAAKGSEKAEVNSNPRSKDERTVKKLQAENPEVYKDLTPAKVRIIEPKRLPAPTASRSSAEIPVRSVQADADQH